MHAVCPCHPVHIVLQFDWLNLGTENPPFLCSALRFIIPRLSVGVSFSSSAGSNSGGTKVYSLNLRSTDLFLVQL